MSSTAKTYNLQQVILGLEENIVRNKGEQEGYIRMRGGSWHIEFAAWVQQPDGSVKYKDGISRKVGPATGPNRIVAKGRAGGHGTGGRNCSGNLYRFC